MLALALLTAWSTAAGASGWTTCAALERSELLEPAVAPARPWDAVRAAFLGYLRSLPDDPAAARAAAFLRRARVTLSAGEISASAGIPASAEYDPASRTVFFEQADADELWTRWDRPEDRAPALEDFVRRQAPVLVHELFHARLRAELGAVPPFAEEELLADAEETLFVMGRLRSDPDAWGLKTLDGKLGGAGDPRWWARAPRRAAPELDWRAQTVTDSGLAERWRMVRGMGAGYDAFERVLREG